REVHRLDGGVAAFRHQVVPVLFARVGYRHGHYAPVRGVLGGEQRQQRSVGTVHDATFRVARRADADLDLVEVARAQVPLEVDQPQVIGARVDGVAQQQPAPVVGERLARAPGGGELRVLLLGQ